MQPLLALALLSCSSGDGPFVRAVVIEDLDQVIGGPKSLAQPGDFLLENDQIRLGILGARNSMGPGFYGGSIVDADRQWADPRFRGGFGNDQLAELFATGNMNVTKPLEGGVTIVKDGSDGTASIQVLGTTEPFLTLLGALWGLVGAPDFEMQTTYELQKGKPYVKLTTVASYNGANPANAVPVGGHDSNFPLIDWAIQTGIVMGDFYLQGGSVNVFAPGIGFDEDGAVFESMQRGENTFTDPFQFDFIAGVGDGISYAITPADGDIFVPLFTASQTVAVGGGRDGDGTRTRFGADSFSYERYFIVGKGDVGSIVDSWVELKGVPYGTVSGHVLESNTGTPLSGVDVFVFPPGSDKPWSQWGTDVDFEDLSPDGSFGGRLPVGEWELLVHDRGRPEAKRLPITVEEGKEVRVQLEAPRNGVFEFTVQDTMGWRLPAKVTIFRLDDAPRRDPVLGDGFVGGQPESVVFAGYGNGQVELAPGRYIAAATRGLEYEIDWSAPFTVHQSASHLQQFVLERTVNSDGWVSADLHVHSQPSHDSGVSEAARVQTMVAEGIEFFAATDHDYISDFAPTVQQMGLEEWVQTAPGVETTTVEVGHFLAFPLQQDFAAESGGAFDWTDMTPALMTRDLYQQGTDAGTEPVVFVGHPRDGILGYFDQYGFNPYAGVPGIGGNPGTPRIDSPTLSITNSLLQANNVSWNFDAIELFNGKRLDLLRTPTQRESTDFGRGGRTSALDMIERTLKEQDDLKDGVYKLAYGVEGQIDDWFTLLNLGFRFTALGNSDTHGTTSVESGCPRNYIMSETDDPAFIDDQAIADAVREHKVVASYGPFMQMWVGRRDGGKVKDQVTIGDELVSQGQPLQIDIEVQAPSWMNVTRLELYENGTLIQEWHISQGDQPLDVLSTTVRQPAEDAWYVAIATGDNDMRPVFTPVEIPYVELQVIVSEALEGVEAVGSLLSPAVPIPRTFPLYPYAMTNPIWVDVNGNGFDAPGIPDWLEEPEDPNAE